MYLIKRKTERKEMRLISEPAALYSNVLNLYITDILFIIERDIQFIIKLRSQIL